MDSYLISGSESLVSGSIEVSGSKNSSLILLMLALLSKSPVSFTNVPKIVDIELLLELFHELNIKTQFENNNLTIDASKLHPIPLVSTKMSLFRASYYFMSVMSYFTNEYEIVAPGGCLLGARPIDIHLDSFELLGMKITSKNCHYYFDSSKVFSGTVHFKFPSLGATVNLIFLALAKKIEITIENYSHDEEIQNLISILKAVGVTIELTEEALYIDGNINIDFNEPISIIKDRIEAGTYVILGLLKGNNLRIKGFEREYQKPLLKFLDSNHLTYHLEKDVLTIGAQRLYDGSYLEVAPYPHFPTDLFPQLSVFLSLGRGLTLVKEEVYGGRFQAFPELSKLGASFMIQGNQVLIKGVSSFEFEDEGELGGKDLRSTAALVLALLMTPGTHHLTGVHHLARGYEAMDEKLRKLGLEIKIE